MKHGNHRGAILRVFIAFCLIVTTIAIGWDFVRGMVILGLSTAIPLAYILGRIRQYHVDRNRREPRQMNRARGNDPLSIRILPHSDSPEPGHGPGISRPRPYTDRGE